MPTTFAQKISETARLWFGGTPVREGNVSSLDLAALALAQDEAGWINLQSRQADNGNDFSDTDRSKLVQRSRLYWHRDPLAKQAVHLYTAYALGQGMEITHKNPFTALALHRFRDDRVNHKLLGVLGLRRLSNKLLVDGEVFLAVWTRNPARPQVRLIDPLQIVEIITNPEDDEDIWYYKRLEPQDGPNAQPRVSYYAAADANWDGLEEEEAVQMLGERGLSILRNKQPGCVIVHVCVNSLGKRGYPLLTASLDWTQQVKKFMEDRATLVHAGAAFAYKKTVRGGPSTVAALAKALREGSPLPGQNIGDNGYDARGPVSGSTLLQNSGIDTEPMNFNTQAGNAVSDARLFKLQFLAGIGGIPEHYFGDSTAGNLATATAMERPVELTLSEYQLTLIAAIEGVCSVVLDAQGFIVAGLAINTPPILSVDQPRLLGSLTMLCNAIPAFNNPIMWRKILSLSGVSDIDGCIEYMEAHNQGTTPSKGQATADGKSAGGFGHPGGGGPPDPNAPPQDPLPGPPAPNPLLDLLKQGLTEPLPPPPTQEGNLAGALPGHGSAPFARPITMPHTALYPLLQRGTSTVQGIKGPIGGRG